MSETGRQNRQRGVTLAEMVIAIAIGAIVVAGSLVFLQRMVTVADENKDKTFASLQVQFVGFWINEDAMQAQSIRLGDAEDDPDGFPLTIEWENGNQSARERITYYFDGDDPSRLLRYRYVEVKEEGVYVEDTGQSGTHVVAEHLVRWDGAAGTRCCRMTAPGSVGGPYESLKSLWVEVAADLDGSRAESTYEIFPRAMTTWHPQEVDDPDLLGEYRGPECPVPTPTPTP